MINTNKNKSQDWNELCDYVKKEILEYDDNMKFPSYLALRLQGLKRGQFIANNNAKTQAKYDDRTLLIAFKVCKNRIITYIHQNENKIKDEKHKINLIVKMVEPEINDVYLRIQENERVKARVENTSFDNQSYVGANYKTRTKEVNEKMKNLF